MLIEIPVPLATRIRDANDELADAKASYAAATTDDERHAASVWVEYASNQRDIVARQLMTHIGDPFK